MTPKRPQTLRRAARASSLAFVVFSLSACRSCFEKEGPPTVLDLAGPDATVVSHVPDLDALVKGLEAFATRATRKVGASGLRRFRAAAEKSFGFDPFEPGALKKLGIDPGAGAVLFATPPPVSGVKPQVVLGLALIDRELFDQRLAAIIKKVDGANHQATKTVSGHQIKTIGRPFGEEVVPVTYWSHYGRYVLVTRAEGKDALVQALTRLDADGNKPVRPTIQTEPTYQSLKTKVPAGLTIFTRQNAADGLVSTPEGVESPDTMTSVTFSAAGLSSDILFHLPSAEIQKALAGDAPLPLFDKIEPGAVAMAVSRAARPEGIEALRTNPSLSAQIDRGIEPLQKATGIDPEKDALPTFKGPLTAALYLTDITGVMDTVRERRSLGRLLDMVHVVLTAELKDAEKMAEVLDSSRERLGERGVKIHKRTAPFGDQPATIYEPDQDPPKLGWALWNDTYVYAVGTGRLEETLAFLAANRGSVAAELTPTVAGKLAQVPGASVLVVRGAAIADAAGQLRIGKKSMGLAAILGSALALLETLGDVAVSVRPDPDGMRLEIREELQ